MPEFTKTSSKPKPQSYQPPAIVDVGAVTELTAGKSNQTSDTATGYKK